MEIQLLSEKENRIKFLLSGANPAFANALRRIASTEVPVMSIEYVDLEENNSGIFDEILAHRLGMVPLTFDDHFSTKDKCKCEGKGCSNCEVTLVLEKQGPCTVRSGDMKSTDDSVRPTDVNIPIVELLEHQRVKFEATAQLGIGKEHIKWQASICGYKYAPKVKIKGDVDPAVCPVNVFEKKDGKVRVARELDCILCMKCTEDEGASVNADETSFIFDVESVSGLSPKQIVSKALEVLEEKAENFENEFKKLL